MKDVNLNSLGRPILRLVRGAICCGVIAKTVLPDSVRFQVIAERHFERGTNYD
jgi:hypothetical protein